MPVVPRYGESVVKNGLIVGYQVSSPVQPSASEGSVSRRVQAGVSGDVEVVVVP